MLGVFRWLMLSRKDGFDRFAIGIRVPLGLLLCGLSLLVIQKSGDLVDRCTESGWFLATFLLALGAGMIPPNPSRMVCADDHGRLI